MSDDNGIVFRDNSVYVMTPSGPIRLTADQSLKPGEFRFDQPAATVSHRCARCGVVFALVGDVTADAIEAGHHERCFVVGDWVRWQVGERWHEGKILALGEHDMEMQCVRGWSSGYPFLMSFTQKNIRRIQRPVQAVQEWRQVFQNGADRSKPCPSCGKMFRDHYGVACEMPRLEDYQKPARRPFANVDRSAPVQSLTPAPTLYDGLDEMSCWCQWSDNRACLERGAPLMYEMTPAQIAAAKASQARLAEQDSISLRARIDAAREQERNRVQMPDDDAWLANCRDAE